MMDSGDARASVTIWTIGHSTRGAEELVAMLAAHGIERVVGVRRFPVSRRHPHFAGSALAASLAALISSTGTGPSLIDSPPFARVEPVGFVYPPARMHLFGEPTEG